MKYDRLILVLALLCPIVTRTQHTVTVRIDIGTCAPHVTGSSNGSGSGAAADGGVASGSQGMTMLSSASNGIHAASTSSSSSSPDSMLSVSIQGSTAINIIPSVVSPSSPAATGPA